MTTYTDADLLYAADARCQCGAGLAYAPSDPGAGVFKGPSAWDCSDILTGRAIPSGQPGAKMHDEPAPFAFYEIKDERQPSAKGRTTRPVGAAAGPGWPERRRMTTYRFEVFQSPNGQWYWHLVAPNGEIMAGSEGYTRKADALRAVRGMKVAVWKATVA